MQNQVETNTQGVASPQKDALAQPLPAEVLIPEDQPVLEQPNVPHLELEANTLANSAPTAAAVIEQPAQVEELRQEEACTDQPEVAMQVDEQVTQQVDPEPEGGIQEPAAEPVIESPAPEQPAPVEQDDGEIKARLFMQVMAKKLPAHHVRQMTAAQGYEQGYDIQQLGACKDGQGPVYLECDIYQAAQLNMRMPKGFRIEQDETVFRAMQQRTKNAENLEKAIAKKKKKELVHEASIAAKNKKLQEKEEQRQQTKSLHEAARQQQKQVEKLAAEKAVQPVASVSESISAPVTQVVDSTAFGNAAPEPILPAGDFNMMSQLAQQEAQAETPSAQPDLNRQPSRTSNRVRPNINYTNLNQGTGEVSANMDYNEVSGQATATGNKPQAKKMNLKVNQDVFKKCIEFFKRIRESPFLTGLHQIAQGSAEFAVQLEVLNQIEKNLKEYKYATTHEMSKEFLKMISGLVERSTADVAYHKKVVDFHLYADGQFNEMGLINKEIYTVQQPPLKTAYTQPDIQTRKEVSQQSKMIGKLQKEIEKIQKQNQNQQKPANFQRAPAQAAAFLPGQKQPPKKPTNFMDTPMTPAEKSNLKDSIPQLSLNQQNGILKIVQDSCPQSRSGEVFEFELDMLTVRKCRELEKYVETCIKENIKKKKRKDADKLRRDKQREIKQAPARQPSLPQAPQATQQPFVQQTQISQVAPAQQQSQIQPQTVPLTIAQTQASLVLPPHVQQQTQMAPQVQPQQQAYQQPAAAPQDLPQNAHQQAPAQAPQQFLYDSLENDQLSTFLFSNPNLPISAKRRQEIEAYRKMQHDLVQQWKQQTQQQNNQVPQQQQQQQVQQQQQQYMTTQQQVQMQQAQAAHQMAQQQQMAQPQQAQVPQQAANPQNQQFYGKPQQPQKDDFLSSSDSDSEDIAFDKEMKATMHQKLPSMQTFNNQQTPSKR